MRLIDADAYADEMRKKQDECQAIYKSAKTEDERNYWEGIFMTFVEAKITLDNIPTVDAVPVVHSCWKQDENKRYRCSNRHAVKKHYYDWLCGDR